MRPFRLPSRMERSFGAVLTLNWFVVVIGAVCCMGLVVAVCNAFFGMEIDIMIMVAMFAPMGLIMALLLWRILKLATRSVEQLEDGLHRVAAGDYSVRLQAERVGGPTRVMYEDFNKMTANLQANELLRTSFVADFSHEFKTPINSINGFAQLLIGNIDGSSPVSEEERRLYLQIIADESERLANLSTNTMLLNRLESQTILESTSRFRLDEQIRACLVLLQKAWQDKNLELEVNLDETEYAGNEEMLKEVWINLLGNAVKFTPKNGTLGVRLVSTPGEARVYVRDTGIGMTEDVRSRVFDRYYQGDPSHATQGHGLGLAITQRIVSLAGGTVEVESTPGAGSTFIVALPTNV